jgi:CheY-like chemotaxis protein
MMRVLLVEDSDDMLFILQMELGWMGYVVDIANDANAAIDIARLTRPDVIVSDLQMPNVDGFVFMRRIRQIPELAGVPAIALTGFSMEREIQRAFDSGFNAYLTKPVDAKDLGLMIESVTTQRAQKKAS